MYFALQVGDDSPDGALRWLYWKVSQGWAAQALWAGWASETSYENVIEMKYAPFYRYLYLLDINGMFVA